MDMIVPIVPLTMYGLLRPYELRLRSLAAAINGWTTTPQIGPAIHTRQVRDFDSPIDIKNG